MKNNEKEIYSACIQLKAALPDGSQMPRLGQGTWKMAEHPQIRKAELNALHRGIELGMTLIDTAEMYGEGLSESLIGEVIKDHNREDLFLVSKVYPHNAGKSNIFKCCDNTLKRLGTDYLDLYLLHWRGNVPLSETAACMEELKKRGKIKRWGVSNFDTEDMEELWRIPDGNKCAVNQVLYHLGSRGIEYDLLPWHQNHGIPIMAYCPLAQAGRLRSGIFQNSRVKLLCKKYDASPAQIMLSFILHNPLLAAIPKAGSVQHIEENAAASLIHLSEEDFRDLSSEFPSPCNKMPLDMQ